MLFHQSKSYADDVTELADLISEVATHNSSVFTKDRSSLCFSWKDDFAWNVWDTEVCKYGTGLLYGGIYQLVPLLYQASAQTRLGEGVC